MFLNRRQYTQKPRPCLAWIPTECQLTPPMQVCSRHRVAGSQRASGNNSQFHLLAKIPACPLWASDTELTLVRCKGDECPRENQLCLEKGRSMSESEGVCPKDQGADPWELHKESVIRFKTVNQAVEKACVEVRFRLGWGKGRGEKKWQKRASVHSRTLRWLRRLGGRPLGGRCNGMGECPLGSEGR